MGILRRRGKGFTLIELLIVVVIIALLAALLLPALMKALCNARSGTASSLINQLAQACKAYELDYAVYPKGNGSGSADMVFWLQKKGAKQLPYFEFPLDMIDTGTKNVINPVFGNDGDPLSSFIYYRNNRANNPRGGSGGGGGTGGSGGGGGSGGTSAPVVHPSSFDIWCAGCDYTSGGAPQAAWSVKYE
jgi:prepilin-type N-terminal cleavage/methylation domain-containing protein